MAAAGKPPEFLSTHPASENRIKELQGHMKDAMSKYEKAQKRGSIRSASGLD